MSSEWEALRCLILGALGLSSMRLRCLTEPPCDNPDLARGLFKLIFVRLGQEFDLSPILKIGKDALLATAPTDMVKILQSNQDES